MGYFELIFVLDSVEDFVQKCLEPLVICLAHTDINGGFRRVAEARGEFVLESPYEFNIPSIFTDLDFARTVLHPHVITPTE